MRFVVADDPLNHLDGKIAIENLVAVSQALQAAGEDRSAIVEYLTAADLIDDDSPES